MWFFSSHPNSDIQDMTSVVKKVVTKATSAVSHDDDLEEVNGALVDPRDTAKYLLQVTAGPSYDPATHGNLKVNGQSYEIENEHMIARINVRIRDYHGKSRRETLHTF